MIAIVTDSVSDLPSEFAQEAGVEVIPAYINIGKESLLDGIDISRQEFYRLLPTIPELPTTSAPPPGSFQEKYEALLNKASHIVSIHTASTLSGIYNAAYLAAEVVDPVRIHVIDSGQISMGLGWVVHAAAGAARAGATLEGVLHSVQNTLKRVRVYALLNTLEYLARSGRVSIVQLGLSTLLNIKPFVEVREGTISSLGRIRTWSRAATALAEQVHALGPIEKLAVMHTNHASYAWEFMERLKDLLRPQETLIVDATTVLGVHTGPQAVGIAAVLRI